MGLWARITRIFRASTGAALDKIENPELVLQQTIRDMRDRVPELNNSVAQVMATERLLLKNHENLEKQVVDLDSKIKASVKMGRDDIATAYIGQLQQAQLDKERTSAQLEHASLASKQALKARDNYVLNMKKRTAEAMQLISAAKQAKLQEQLAQTMEAFNIGGSVRNALLVMSVQALATLTPFTPGGAGAQQALLVFVFRDIASKTAVLAYSVGQQIAIAAFNATAGLIALFLMVGHTDFRSIVRLGREEEEREAEGAA